MPSSIKPTNFLNWYNPPRKLTQNSVSLKKNLSMLLDLLKSGSGLKILVTLQPSNTVEFLKSLNLLNLSQHTVKIRPHPRRKISEQDLQKILKFKFFYDRTSLIDETLDNIDLHITEYSSCVLDCMQMGIPSICLHSLANHYFSDIKTDGLVRIYDCVEEFIEEPYDV